MSSALFALLRQWSESDGVRRWSRSLTVADIRAQSAILLFVQGLLTLVSLFKAGPYGWTGDLKGVDFLQFYTLGAFHAGGDLAAAYDWELFRAATEQVSGHAGSASSYFPVYPPQLAVLFAPFSQVGFVAALSLWTVASTCLYALVAVLMYRELPAFRRVRVTWWMLVGGFPPFHQTVLHGQVSILILACLAAGWLAMRHGHWFWVGAALGSLAFKPQFGVVCLLLLVLRPDRYLLAGLTSAALLQIGLTLALAGGVAWQAWLFTLPRLVADQASYAPKLWQMQSMRAFFDLLIGRGTLATFLWVGAVAVVLALLWQLWRRHESPDIRYAGLIVAAVLVSPHVYIYDAVVLGVPVALIASRLLDGDGSAAHPLLALASYGVLLALLLAPLAMVTRVQLTSPLLVLLLASLCIYGYAPDEDHARPVYEPEAK